MKVESLSRTKFRPRFVLMTGVVTAACHHEIDLNCGRSDCTGSLAKRFAVREKLTAVGVGVSFGSGPVELVPQCGS